MEEVTVFSLVRSRLKWTVANLSHPLHYPETSVKVNTEFVDPDQIPSCVIRGEGGTCEHANDASLTEVESKFWAAQIYLLCSRSGWCFTDE